MLAVQYCGFATLRVLMRHVRCIPMIWQVWTMERKVLVSHHDVIEIQMLLQRVLQILWS